MNGTGRLDALLDAYDDTQAQRFTPEQGEEGELQPRPGSAPPNHRKRSRNSGGSGAGGSSGMDGGGRGIHNNVSSGNPPRYPPPQAPVGGAYQGAKPPTVSGKEVDEISDFLSYICSGSTVSHMHVDARLGRLEADRGDGGSGFGFGEEGMGDADIRGENEDDFTQRFRNGVRPEDFQYILSFLEQDSQKECSFRDWTEYIYDHEKGHLCLCYDNDTGKLCGSVYENRRTNLDLVTPHLPYDCRVSLSTKEPAPAEKSPPPDFKRKVEKKRWSFYKQRNIWKIDLTEMRVWTPTPSTCPYSSDEEDEDPFQTAPKTPSPASNHFLSEGTTTDADGLYLQENTTKYEIRFELMADVLQSLVHTDRQNLEYIAAKFWQTVQFFSKKRPRGAQPARRPLRHGNPAAVVVAVPGAPGGATLQVRTGPPPGAALSRRGGVAQQQPQRLGVGSPTYIGGSPSPSPTMAAAANRGGFNPSRSSSHSRSPSLSPPSPMGGDFFSSMERSASNAYSAASAALRGEFSPPEKSLRADEGFISSFPFTEFKVRSVEGHHNDELRRICLRIIFGPGREDDGPDPYARPSFPGALPVNFTRRHWKMVQNKPYLVSEKTDGVRFMLLINETGVYLTSRSFDFMKVEGYDQLIPLMASNGPTLLDGEMVHHHSSKRLFYLIFDALCVNGTNHTKENLMGRLKQVRDLVVVRYREAVDNGTIRKSDHPFVLIGKQFFDKKLTKKVFDHIRKDKENGDYFYRDDKRYHKTDGIIFTPNEAYTVQANRGLLKWKYPEKSSVDFKLLIKTPRNNQHGHPAANARSSASSSSSAMVGASGVAAVSGKEYWLVARGRDRQGDIECDVAQFSSSDRQRLKHDMKKYNIGKEVLHAASHYNNNVRNLIVECCYDTDKGKWRYVAIRRDKTQPNNIKTAFNAIIALAENITKEELIYRATRNPKNDEWRLIQQTKSRSRTSSVITSSSASNSSSSSSSSASKTEALKNDGRGGSKNEGAETPPLGRKTKKRRMSNANEQQKQRLKEADDDEYDDEEQEEGEGDGEDDDGVKKVGRVDEEDVEEAEEGEAKQPSDNDAVEAEEEEAEEHKSKDSMNLEEALEEAMEKGLSVDDGVEVESL
ncbi:HAT C-terminal dimerization domain [Balamuthia mandrillaris]